MGVTVKGGFGQAHPIDDTGVVEFIGEDDIAFAHEGGNDAEVGHVTGIEEDGPGRALEGGHFFFDLLVQGQGADDEAGGGAADAPAGGCGPGGLD